MPEQAQPKTTNNATPTSRASRASRRLIGVVIAGVLAAGATFGIRYWQATQAATNWENLQVQKLSAHSDKVWSVAFSPDGQTVASASEDKTIKLWNPQASELIRTFTGHTKPVLSVAFSPNGETLVSGSKDTTIKLWNPETGELIRTLKGHSKAVRSATFSPDGRILASCGWDADNSIKIWNPETGELIQTLKGHAAGIFATRFSADGQTVASASN